MSVRIDLRNKNREPQFRVDVDLKSPPTVVKPPSGSGPEIYFEWDQAIDDRGHLRRCPACGCRELFVRKDFPQVTGLVIIVLAAVVSLALLGVRQVLPAIAVLVATAVVDAMIYLFTSKCLVCYRCRTEYRDLPIRPDHAPFDLAVAEKYRPEWDGGTPPTSPESAPPAPERSGQA